MDDLQKRVRKFVFDQFLERSVAPTIEEIMRNFELTRVSAYAALKELEAQKQLTLLKDTQRILMAWPFSNIATPFKVTSAGHRQYYANCAWDAIAFYVMLKNDIRVESFCHHCAEPLEITLSHNRATTPESSKALVYLFQPAREWWEDIVKTCSNNMVFFKSGDHLKKWLTENPGESGQAMSIEQTLKVSAPIYGGKMELDYARPSREVQREQYRSAGLTGDFWEF